MGHYSIRPERSHYDFEWEQDKSTSFSHYTAQRLMRYIVK